MREEEDVGSRTVVDPQGKAIVAACGRTPGEVPD
jgi:hypothetical protein